MQHVCNTVTVFSSRILRLYPLKQRMATKSKSIEMSGMRERDKKQEDIWF